MKSLDKLLREPPFRLLSKQILKLFRISCARRSLWDLSERPQYLLGLVAAANQARREGRSSISAIEFGVAGGAGLLALQREAAAVSAELGVEVRVFGFDTGEGLPALAGNYRDHPDVWIAGDYPMDPGALQAKLHDSTELILGDIRDTSMDFFEKYDPPPIGFLAVDVDFYSSTVSALEILRAPRRKMLLHFPVYCDDIDMFFTHERGGELLAVKEFNESQSDIFIDRWRGVKNNRPFPEMPYLNRMFVAHHLAAISTSAPERDVQRLSL